MNVVQRLQVVILLNIYFVLCVVLGFEDVVENKIGQVFVFREIMFWLEVFGLYNCVDVDVIN